MANETTDTVTVRGARAAVRKSALAASSTLVMCWLFGLEFWETLGFAGLVLCLFVYQYRKLFRRVLWRSTR
jgi:hypothetical protein